MNTANVPTPASENSEFFALAQGVSGTFGAVGKPPSWLNRLTDDPSPHWSLERLAEALPVLEIFITDAQAFWEQAEAGQLCSDPWTQPDLAGGEIALQATAVFDGEVRLLVIAEPAVQSKRERALEQARRDALLARDHARIASRVADEANKLKSQFLANMSHELRTPLNAIILYSELLTDDATDLGLDRFVADLRKIHNAGHHLLGLINSVLDLSKIEAGKMEIYCESFGLAKLAAEVADTIKPLVAKNDNCLVMDIAPDAGNIHSDLTKVRQMLFNLLSNATKFTKVGTITLSISREAQDFITIAVTDTGIGMTPDQLTKMFQAFAQADASTTRKYGGTGLGLTITKKFAELLGGDVAVASEFGKGTTFTVRLPAAVKTG